MKKFLVVGLIVLFVGAGFIPSTIGEQKEKKSIQIIGSPGYIQDLIDNASDGDTINIPSGIYYENIIINKSISLVGEDKDTTVIDASGNGTVIKIHADCVNISGFTIQNSGKVYSYSDSGIYIRFNYTTITGNIIDSNYCYGIYTLHSNNDNITNNILSNNGYGIHLHSSINSNIKRNNIIFNKYSGIVVWGRGNSIIENTILNNMNGILFSSTSYNVVKGNTIISNNHSGITIYASWSNIVNGNNIQSNGFGILLEDITFGNIILKNNFIDNEKDAFFSYNFFCFNLRTDRWRQNFWNESIAHPKLIFGEKIIRVGGGFGGYKEYLIPWIIPQIDFFPAKEPYDIGA